MRNSDDCAAGHVFGDAQRLPLSIPPVRVQEVPSNQPVVTCRSDVRSTQVAHALRRAGLPVTASPQ